MTPSSRLRPTLRRSRRRGWSVRRGRRRIRRRSSPTSTPLLERQTQILTLPLVTTCPVSTRPWRESNRGHNIASFHFLLLARWQCGLLVRGNFPKAWMLLVSATLCKMPTWRFQKEGTHANGPAPTTAYVCFSPGTNADDAYTALLRELRKYATAKGKGSLMSDGVSAANSAAF